MIMILLGQQEWRPARLLYVLLPGFLLVLLVAASYKALAHGGHDHAEADALALQSAGAEQLSTHGVSGNFELLLKYPPPEGGKPTRLRFFLAEYATNRAVAGARFVVASRPRGLVTHSAPVMTAPGIYEMTVVFPADTVYSLVATLAARDASEQIELPHVYVGEAARQFLAEHGGASRGRQDEGGDGTSWLLPLVILGAAVLGIGSFLGVRSALGRKPIASATVNAHSPINTTPVTAPERREEDLR